MMKKIKNKQTIFLHTCFLKYILGHKMLEFFSIAFLEILINFEVQVKFRDL